MTRKVYACKEFEVVGVPVDELVVAGRADIYREASGKGFFDIDLRNNELVVTAKNYVGLIPLNDHVAIHVIPRFPIGNLFAIIARSDESARFLHGFSRTYSVGASTDQGVSRLFGEKIVKLSGHLAKTGLYRKYVPELTSTNLDGELLFTETVSRFRSAGIRYRHVRRRFNLSPSIVENRVIKGALTKLVGFYGQSNDAVARKLRRQAEQLLISFDQVQGALSPSELKALVIPRLISGLPPMHQSYGAALWLSYLLETSQGVSLERVGSANFDTFVVNLADVFESYVRNVLDSQISSIHTSLRLRDGNKSPAPLFVDTDAFVVQPDIYLVQGARPVAIVDAKYKLEVKPADRYEVISFCEALQVKLAILLAPFFPGCEAVRSLGTTPSGIRVVILRVDLGAVSLQAEESLLVERVRDLLIPELAQP